MPIKIKFKSEADAAAAFSMLHDKASLVLFEPNDTSLLVVLEKRASLCDLAENFHRKGIIGRISS